MKSCSYSKVSPISEDLVAIKVDTSAGAVLELGGQCYDGRRDAIDNFHSVGHVALCERDRTGLVRGGRSKSLIFSLLKNSFKIVENCKDENDCQEQHTIESIANRSFASL